MEEVKVEEEAYLHYLHYLHEGGEGFEGRGLGASSRLHVYKTMKTLKTGLSGWVQG
jgi:hypothetical protein